MDWNKYRRWLIPLIVFILALIPRVLRLGTFWGTDERYHWQLSNEFFLALTRGDWANTIPQGLPGVTLAWIDSIAMGLRYGWIWLTGGQPVLDQIMAIDRPYQLLAQRQLPMVLVNTLVVVGIYLLAQRIIGWKAAFGGATLIALNPFFLAELRVLRFEALVTGFMLLAFLAAFAYFKENRIYLLILSAVFTAVAMLAKISAIFLFPMIGLLGLVIIISVDYSNKQQRQPFFRSTLIPFTLKYLLWVILALFFFWLFWPAMWVTPLKTLQEVWEFVGAAGEEGMDGRGVFFWGKVYPDDPGYGFYPVALLFRLTPSVLFGVLIAIVFLFLIRKRGWPVRDERGWQWGAVVLLLVYALAFFVMMMLGAKKYDRYLMPIFPALDLVAGIGWLWLGKWTISRWWQLGRPGVVLGVGWLALLILQGLTTLPHLPYYYTYYNPLLGGIHNAANYIQVGYGEGVDQVAAYMESKPNASEIKWASGYSSKLEGLFSGETIAMDNLDGRWVQADYVMIYLSHIQRGKHFQDILDYLQRQNSEYVLNLHGQDYAKIYPGPSAQYYGGGHKLEGRGTLFGYDLSATTLAAGDILTTTLYWRNEGRQKDDLFFVRLKDIDGYVWAEGIAKPRPGFEEAAQVRLNIVESEAVLTLSPGMPPGEYFFQPGFRTVAGKIIGYFQLPGDTKPLVVTSPDTYPSGGVIQPAYPARFMIGEDIELLGYDVTSPENVTALSVWLTLYWQALTDVNRDYVILIRLLDDNNEEKAFWLGRPVRSGLPTQEWRSEQLVQDPWLLTLPEEVPAGTFQLEVGLFDAETQQEVGRQMLGEINFD